jgi:hypothetical protein
MCGIIASIVTYGKPKKPDRQQASRQVPKYGLCRGRIWTSYERRDRSAGGRRSMDRPSLDRQRDGAGSLGPSRPSGKALWIRLNCLPIRSTSGRRLRSVGWSGRQAHPLLGLRSNGKTCTKRWAWTTSHDPRPFTPSRTWQPVPTAHAPPAAGAAARAREGGYPRRRSLSPPERGAGRPGPRGQGFREPGAWPRSWGARTPSGTRRPASAGSRASSAPRNAGRDMRAPSPRRACRS